VAPARFGTDGVRGVANEELTAELALAIGRATARVLPGPAFVVGRDTRRSGPLLQAAFGRAGHRGGRRRRPRRAAHARRGLPWPSPRQAARRHGLGLAQPLRRQRDQALQLARGPSCPSRSKAESSASSTSILADPDRPPRRPTGHGVGRIIADPGAADLYRDIWWRPLEGRTLEGCTSWSTAPTARPARSRPGLRRARGDGHRPARHARRGQHQREVRLDRPGRAGPGGGERQADLGLAFDGDADRVIAVDHTGTVVDGDVLLALFALDLAEPGHLAGNTVVVTVMTNLGFRLAMESHGIGVRETDVGDRHVLAALDADGLALGGEQSGHIIFRTRSTTGDGILTGIALADLMQRSGRSLADLAHGLVERVPQVLVNVPIPNPSAWPTAPRSGRRWPRPRPSSGTTGGCCCARAAPSRWCG
jgi:phosphoglucosamine mutase